MKTQLKFKLLVSFIALLFTNLTFAQRIGDPGMVFDESKYDSRIPLMKEWAKAGVQGGIPFRNTLKIRATLTPKGGDRVRDIQNAINKAAADGGGVVLLKAGNYSVASEIFLKSNVVLRGEGKGKTWLISRHRFQGKNEADKRATINLRNNQRTGLEDFSMRYEYLLDGKPAVPVDLKWDYNTFLKFEVRKQAYQNEKVFYPNQSPKANLRHKIVKNIDVGFVELDGNTKNCWIDNCEFLNSGSFGIRFRGAKQSHVTIRDVKVRGALQAGSNGHGYGINCSAKYTLMVGCDVSHVRHWAIQQGAEYCVVVNSKSGTDMNFHQKDLGKNLIEKCDLILPDWHLWRIFQTGATFHGDPGKDNYFYDNNASKGGDKQFTDQKIYTFSGRDLIPLKSGIFPPKHRILYAMKSNGSKPKPNPTPTPKPSDNKAPKISFKTPNAKQSFKVGATVEVEVVANKNEIEKIDLYLNNKFVRNEKVSPYTWGIIAADGVLKNMKAGNYTLKAVASGKNGKTSEISVNVTVGNPKPSTPPISSTNAPIGKIITLKKSGGDKKYVTAEKSANDNQVWARGTRLGKWEQFLVEAHPKGGIALKALSNGKYLRVANTSTTIPVRAKGEAKAKWEQFQWKNKGNGKVALKSVHNGKWLQARHSTNNALVLPKGDKDLTWETFNYEIVSGKKELSSDIIGLFPNPARTKGSLFLEIDAQVAEKATIAIFDIIGKEIVAENYDISEGNTLLDISNLNKNLSAGVYIISYVTGSTNSTYKLIIE